MGEQGEPKSGPGWVESTEDEHIEALNSRVVKLLREKAHLLRVIQSLRDLTTDAGCDRMLNIREQADEAIERYGSPRSHG